MSRRSERVGEQLRSEISRLLKAEVTDPRIGLVTLMRVEVAADLCSANVFWSALGQDPERDVDKVEEVQAGLDSAKGFLRRRLAEELPLRRVPEITFRHDVSIKLGSRTLDILNEIENESKS
jgi:ribosome-binding factor A